MGITKVLKNMQRDGVLEIIPMGKDPLLRNIICGLHAEDSNFRTYTTKMGVKILARLSVENSR